MVLFALTANSEIPANLATQQIAVADLPVAFVSANDGTGRMFIVEKKGVIKIFKDGKILDEPFLDISSQVASTSEQGLLGLAFDPQFDLNQTFYVNYNKLPTFGVIGNTLIASFIVSSNPNIADASSQQVVTEIPQEFNFHMGGNIAFSPEGYLHIGLGDGGRSQYAQQNNHAYGKLYRIKVNRDILFKSGLDEIVECGLPQNYEVPINNPYVADFGACNAIYLKGMRNPWRWSFDRLTGDMFIGDVGADMREEVSQIKWGEPSGNLGWPCQEGDVIYSESCISEISDLINPIFSYPHDNLGHSVVGGYRYRGEAISDLYGTYLFHDIYSETFYFANETGSNWSFEIWAESLEDIVSYGEDEQGELYFVSSSGPIYKLIQE